MNAEIRVRDNAAIKVELAWLDYRDRGLRLPTTVIDEAAEGQVLPGRVVVVFDRDLEFTQHLVASRNDEHVVLTKALPWRDDPEMIA